MTGAVVNVVVAMWSVAGTIMMMNMGGVDGLAPPHPIYFSEYESLSAYRLRNNITYNYTPKNYPADHCRFLTEEQCRRDDEAADGESKERRKRILRGNRASTDGGQRELNPHNRDGIKVLVFLRYFPEHAGIVSQLPKKEYFDTLLNGVGPSDVNPIGGMAEWLHFSSLKTMGVHFDVQDWTVTQKSEAQYSGGNAGRVGVLSVQDIFRDELDKLDSSGFDFSPYDSDNDGYLDGVMAFHSGTPAELGPASCAADYLQRIWSQASRGPDPEGWKSSSGLYTLDGFTVSGATTRPLCTEDGTNKRVYTPTNMAIHAHELGHTWQLDDFYDQTPGETGVAGIGSFDVMRQAYGWNYDGTRPGYPSTYNKMKSGWLEPVEITQDGFYAIQPIELSGLAYKISGPFPDGEYLLIESRYPYRWNEDWPTKGIAIYHVDEKAPLQTAKGYPGMPGFPAKHYLLSVLQKDGNYDIEKNVNTGDEGDFWVLNDELGPGPSTWPNTDAIQGAQTQTGLKIKITTAPSLVTQFQVSGYKKWPGGTGMAPGLDSSAFGQEGDGSATGSSASSSSGAFSDAIGTSREPLSTQSSSSSSSSSAETLTSGSERDAPLGLVAVTVLAIASALATVPLAQW